MKFKEKENGMNRNLVTTFIGVDLSERKPDWSSLGIIELKNKTIESRIIRTDNPKPDFWLKKFLENKREKEIKNGTGK